MADKPKSLLERARDVIALAEKADRSIDDISTQLNQANLLFSDGMEGGLNIAKDYMQSADFKKKQHAFFQATFPQGEVILNNAMRLYDSGIITVEQKNKVAEIGHTIILLPAKVALGKMSLDEASTECQNQLKALQSVANIPEMLKQTRELVGSGLETGAKAFLKSEAFQQMRHEFFQATFPVGEVILDKAVSLYHSGVINAEQRNELAAIGENILSLPFEVISGKLALEDALPKLGENITELEVFFKDNFDAHAAFQVGGEILSNMHPLGKFAVNFANVVVNELSENGTPKNVQEGLMFGLNILVKSLGSLEGELQTEIDRVSRPER